ncbi:MAG TPA: hypothetical protein VGL53_17580 [Bryobacteraceae bacterium]|jgi:hypothetical protein
MSNPTPNAQQQIMLSLAYLAYIDELIPGIPSPDAQIKTDLINALSASAPNPIPPVAGQWDVVWGPVTYTVPGSYYQDNLMYVAKSNATASGPAQYAVAVRGTNGKVLLDWLIEDSDVVTMMPWPMGATGSAVKGMISESTSIGLTVLLTMKDATSGLSLFTFLANEMNSVTQAGVCFAGHSLGSALASTLALYARDNQSTWDPSSKATVTTINFAGPTAGDENFATYFDNSFAYTGASKLPFWTSPAGLTSYADCIRNSYDVAPLFWNVSTLADVSSMYDWHLVFPPLGTGEVISDIIVPAVTQQNYLRIQDSQEDWEGTFVSQSPTDDYIAQVEYQHSDAYTLLLGVPSLLTVFNSSIPKRAPAALMAKRLAAFA